ncbi:hypothetical protein EHO59_02205 [Leptospira semungkisensis]|uniref:Uncharacterized protein n=1 Tax=Leptospira semungkisensis TaxID=2484985 RepID=A0A4R9G633_9LEPT|nr:hypothetical protein [Leptospira semungkisensis]TGK06954.1 hypothetical protein EHO59_02205 [Leptospira semungkisensis]
MRHMHHNGFRAGKIFLLLLFVPLFFFGLSYVVWQLWNWLLPDLFGFKQINYWQALGLFVLAHLLFKGGSGFGFGGGHHHHRKRHWKRAMKERMRAKLQEKLDQLDRD